jgi:ATP-dependent Clp protease ATP-binding subunit ClpB
VCKRTAIAKLPSAYGGAQPGMSPRLNLVTQQAQAEADRLKDDYVSTEHLLVAMTIVQIEEVVVA